LFLFGLELRSPSPRPGRYSRAGSEPYVPPPTYWNRGSSVPRRAPSVFDRATSLAPFTRPAFRASSLEPLDELFASKSIPPAMERPSVFERAGSPSPTPVKAGRWGPRPTEVAYDADGKLEKFSKFISLVFFFFSLISNAFGVLFR